jgi:hypothetical protein
MFPQRLKFDIDIPAHMLDAVDISPNALEPGGAWEAPERLEPGGAWEAPERLEPGGAWEVPERLEPGGAWEAPERLEPEGGADILLENMDLDTALEILLGIGSAAAAENGGPGDAAEAVHMTRQEKLDTFMRELLDIIRNEIQNVYFGIEDVYTTLDDIVVMESSGLVPGGYKFSYHIVVTPYAVANNEEAKGLTARVLAQLPAQVRRFVDTQVNKSVQCFRLTGSTKPNSGRTKVVTTRFGTANLPREATVVRAQAGARILPRQFTEETADGQLQLRGAEPVAPEIGDEDLRRVLETIAQTGASANHEFLRAQRGLLLFRRTAPGFCALCGRTHDNDNTFMVVIVPAAPAPAAPDPAARVPHRLLEYCRRKAGATRELALVDLPPQIPYNREGFGTPEARQTLAGHKLATRIAEIQARTVDVHLANATRLEELPQRNVYSEPRMRAYEPVPTLAVKAQMKLGKTKALREYLDLEYPVRPGALRPPVIRMVTFRQTFSKNMQQESFQDFALYSQHAGDFDHVRYPRLIIQVESLHRLRLGVPPVEPIDLLILDEVESILAQFNSGLLRRFNEAFATFRWMIETAGRVICMDANVGDRTLHVLEEMRPKHPITFHWNRYQRAAGDQYFFTSNQAIWLDHIYERLNQGQRIVIPTNSLKEARACEASIRRRYPDRAVRLYSSETPPSIKERHFADVHTHWSGLDVLIYTPTVSAGVSYEREHFDVLFGYFTDMSCNVETCRQMLARVRQIRTGEHFLCLSGRFTNLPTDIADIRRMVFDQRSNLYREIGDVGGQLALRYEYAPNGQVHYYGSPYFRLWLETVRIDNLSKNSFVQRFLDQVADTGAAVSLLEALPEALGRLAEIKADHAGLKTELAGVECAAIAAAPELEPGEAEMLAARVSHQEDISEVERLSLVKYRLRDTYRWQGRPLDATFVANYQSPATVQVYRNLLQITAGPTVLDSLSQIQTQEAGNNRLLMAQAEGGRHPGFENRDLRHRYVFTAHFLAIWLLRLCGFSCLTDRTTLREETVYHNMLAGEQELVAKLRSICYEFSIPRPNPKAFTDEREVRRYVSQVLRIVNAVLRKMYGLKVTRARTTGLCCLEHTAIGRLFALSPEPPPGEGVEGQKPHIPSQLARLDNNNHQLVVPGD